MSVDVCVFAGMKVLVGAVVAVGKLGVAEALVTPITTGVAVTMDGVEVGGRNGVGGLPGKGWITHPLHELIKTAAKIAGTSLFILSPLDDCIPLNPNEQSTRWAEFGIANTIRTSCLDPIRV